MLLGPLWPEARVVGVPPPVGTVITVPSAVVRPVDAGGVNGDAVGVPWPEARVVGVPPPVGTFITVPPP